MYFDNATPHLQYVLVISSRKSELSSEVYDQSNMQSNKTGMDTEKLAPGEVEKLIENYGLNWPVHFPLVSTKQHRMYSGRGATLNKVFQVMSNCV